MMVTIIAAFSGPFLMVVIALLAKIALTKEENRHKTNQEFEPFVASEYFSRMEKAALDILEVQKPVDQAIVLWWGLDGLRLNEDGTLEWVSRKKKPVETTPYQMCQLIQPIQTSAFLADQTQCTRAQIDTLMAKNTALQMQAWQSAQIANAIQQCCVQYPAQYPSYYYGGCCRLN